MASVQYGSAEYKFGFDDPEAESIAAAVGIKPQTLSVSGEPEFTAEGKNLDGLTEAFVVADKKFSFTMSGFVTDVDLVNANGSFTYKGRFFILVGNKVDIANTDFQKAEVTGMSYPLINGVA
jgi:hypothetical protein